jgi:hypothetical protein
MTITISFELGPELQVVRAGLDAVRRNGDDAQARVALDLIAKFGAAVQEHGAAEHKARIEAQVEARLAERQAAFDNGEAA